MSRPNNHWQTVWSVGVGVVAVATAVGGTAPVAAADVGDERDYTAAAVAAVIAAVVAAADAVDVCSYSCNCSMLVALLYLLVDRVVVRMSVVVA